MRLISIKAPWTDAQVTRLNAYQANGRFHPFTCMNRGDGNHQGEGRLTATPAGWICPSCAYTQDWAHAFMVAPLPEVPR